MNTMVIVDSVIIILLLIVSFLVLTYTLQHGVYVSILATGLAEGVALATLFALMTLTRGKKKQQ